MAAAPTVGPEPGSVTRCDGAAGHRWYVQGYARGPREGLDCDRPLRVLCRDCDGQTRWACANHRESRCKPCSARYRRRVRVVASSGMSRHVGFLYLLTCTAPGEQAHCKAGCLGRTGKACRVPAHERCPCTPDGGVDLAAWNTSHSRRWNHLRGALKRDYPGLKYFRGVEVQGRGALHDHAMVWSPVPLDLAAVRVRAMAAGFGHSVDLAPCEPGSRKAAYYVSKYVTKATDKRDDVPWLGELVDVATGEVTVGRVPGRYRTWSQSQDWGDTMADVRARARAYARQRSDDRDQAAAVRALEVLTGVFGVLLPIPEPLAGAPPG